MGIGRTTHRAIAARAGVPLGATTYYFPTLDDLVTAGLEQASDAVREELATWSEALAAGEDLPHVLAGLVEDYLADRSRALLECELYLAAARSPRLRPLVDVWLDGTREVLAPRTGEETARALVTLIDGVLIQSLVTGENLDRRRLEAAIARLVGRGQVQ